MRRVIAAHKSTVQILIRAPNEPLPAFVCMYLHARGINGFVPRGRRFPGGNDDDPRSVYVCTVRPH